MSHAPTIAAPPRAWTAALVGCFALSGLGSLVLEVVWTRKLQLVFGSTTLAVSTTLVAYMLGLGLGGWLGGRLAHRLRNPVRAYGWLEVTIALCSLLVPLAIDRLPELLHPAMAGLSFWPRALVHFAVAIGILIAPTIGMGATLPILVAALVRSDTRIGERLALLYGLNTLGAVLGVGLATFVLFRAFGVLGAGFVGAGVDLAVGLLALAVLARTAAPPQLTASPQTGIAGGGFRLLLLGSYAGVGFTALAYEVAWTRALGMILGSSIYAFAAMLMAFLIGIALGSLAARRWIDRLRRPILWYTAGVAALALTSAATSYGMPLLPDAFVWATERLGFGPATLPLIHVGISIGVMLPPTLLLGALFPLLIRALSADATAAPRVTGQAYLANTLGSAAGAFATGFLLIPWLGLRDTLLSMAATNLLVAAALVVGASGVPRRTRSLGLCSAIASLALLLLFPPSWDTEPLTRGVFYNPTRAHHAEIELLEIEGYPRSQLLLYRDGVSASVSVHRDRGQLFLRINGKTDAGSQIDMPTQVLLGQIPLLFGPPSRDVLVIGLGSGVSSGSVALHPVERIDTVEIEPAVVEAAHLFDEYSGRALHDARVHVIADDGRSHLMHAPRSYDTIISEPSNPWLAGASSLFTREFFAGARRALRPGGRLVQWVHLYGLDTAGVRAILAAIRAEFPNVYGFAHRFGGPDLILMATLEPLEPDALPDWDQLSEPVREDLRRIGTFSKADLWSLLRLLPADVDRLIARGGTINTDDNLFVELRAAWTLYEATLEANWREFARFELGVLPLLERAGPMPADRLAELAMAYLTARKDFGVSDALAARASNAGASLLALSVFRSRPLSGESTSSERRLLDRALQARPDLSLARLLRAELALAAGEPGAALEDLDHVLARVPRDPEASPCAPSSCGRQGELRRPRRLPMRYWRDPFTTYPRLPGARPRVAMSRSGGSRTRVACSSISSRPSLTWTRSGASWPACMTGSTTPRTPRVRGATGSRRPATAPACYIAKRSAHSTTATALEPGSYYSARFPRTATTHPRARHSKRSEDEPFSPSGGFGAQSGYPQPSRSSLNST